MPRIVLRTCLIGVAALLLASCNKRPSSPANQFRVALITPGSIADAAWNSGAYAGLLRIRDSLGASISHVEALTPANVLRGADGWEPSRVPSFSSVQKAVRR